MGAWLGYLCSYLRLSSLAACTHGTLMLWACRVQVVRVYGSHRLLVALCTMSGSAPGRTGQWGCGVLAPVLLGPRRHVPSTGRSPQPHRVLGPADCPVQCLGRVERRYASAGGMNGVMFSCRRLSCAVEECGTRCCKFRLPPSAGLHAHSQCRVPNPILYLGMPCAYVMRME
jgi:hypothetical protein